MILNKAFMLPKLSYLPEILPSENVLRMDIQDDIPVIRASEFVEDRIKFLLASQRERGLTDSEIKEFDQYEEIDDFLSLLNRIIRNMYQTSDTV